MLSDTANAKVRMTQVFPAALLIVLFAVVSIQRNHVWDTKLSLWRDAAQKSPNKSRVHNNLGNCYMLLKKPFSAIEEYKTAASLDPGNIAAYYNLALNFEDVGILTQARYYYEIFCKSAPAVYQEQRQASCKRALQLGRGMDRSK